MIQLTFRSAHGDRFLLAAPTESIVDVCRKYGIPTTQVSTYFRNDRGELTLFVKPRGQLGEYARGADVVIVPNRNIDYHALLGGSDFIREKPQASTWRRVRSRDPQGEQGFITELLDPEDARAVVASDVKETLLACGIDNSPMVVGVSGGGDSNALLGSLVQSGIIARENILPVMMLGIPDWDTGADRAASICTEHGLSLRLVQPGETASILGFKDPESDWVTSFERAFPGDDLEVLGVYAVRRVLESVARETGARTIALGSNLEDCLADVLYYVCAGKVPYPKPLGPLGDLAILYPLWLTPKATIDGCYPKYSLENYVARYPSRMLGRAYFYYLAQMLVDAYPGAGQDLLRGASELSREHFGELPYDSEFETHTLEPIPFDIRLKLRKLFGRRTVE